MNTEKLTATFVLFLIVSCPCRADSLSIPSDLDVDGRLSVRQLTANVPAIQFLGGSRIGPHIQTFGLDGDATAWMGLGVDMTGTHYDNSIYFPNVVSGEGKLTIGDYNGTVYNTRVVVTQAGNVGVGTLTPSAKLEVNGTMKVSGAASFSAPVRVPPGGDLDMGDFTASTPGAP